MGWLFILLVQIFKEQRWVKRLLFALPAKIFFFKDLYKG
jgi:hypothetical protein